MQSLNEDICQSFPKAPSPGLSFQMTIELFRKTSQPTHLESDRRSCIFCEESCLNTYEILYKHVKQHLHIVPYQCCQCPVNAVDRTEIIKHIQYAHEARGEILSR